MFYFLTIKFKRLYIRSLLSITHALIPLLIERSIKKKITPGTLGLEWKPSGVESARRSTSAVG